MQEVYEFLKAELEENDGIFLELDPAHRSVAEQQEIMDDFTGKYGADYAVKTVAQPGYSEHRTGLALDLYFRIQNDDSSFADIYYNEDMEKAEFRGLGDDTPFFFSAPSFPAHGPVPVPYLLFQSAHHASPICISSILPERDMRRVFLTEKEQVYPALFRLRHFCHFHGRISIRSSSASR